MYQNYPLALNDSSWYFVYLCIHVCECVFAYLFIENAFYCFNEAFTDTTHYRVMNALLHLKHESGFELLYNLTSVTDT